MKIYNTSTPERKVTKLTVPTKAQKDIHPKQVEENT